MRIAATLAVVAALAGCGTATSASTEIVIDEPGQIADPGDVVLKVNGYAIGRKETDLVFRSMGVPDESLDEVTSSRMGYHVLEDYALATALYRKAVETELYKDPEVQLQLAFAQRQALSQAMHRKLALDSITDEQVAAWIERHKEGFSMPQVKARQIVVAKRSHAEELLSRLQAGESFAQLAKDHSTDPQTAKNGGETGWFSKADNPLIGEAVFAHAQTKMLGPIESRAGFHIVEVLERRESTPAEERDLIARGSLERDAALEARTTVRNAMNVEWTTPPADPHPPGTGPSGSEGGDAHGAGDGHDHGAGDGHDHGEGDGHDHADH
ncbi:MAG: peptidylprolyl isomerase [Myxococcales bacterium]|nr:peptidylprolyl isomerase [Myxococcales bacterium]